MRGTRRRGRTPADPREKEGNADGSSQKSPRQCIGNVDMSVLIPVPDSPGDMIHNGPGGDELLEKTKKLEAENAKLKLNLNDMRTTAKALAAERDQAVRDPGTARDHGAQLQLLLQRKEVEAKIHLRGVE